MLRGVPPLVVSTALALGLAACGGSDPVPDEGARVDCPATVALEGFLGEEGEAHVTCEVSGRPTLVEIAATGPFRAALQDSSRGNPVLEIRFYPTVPGPQSGELHVRYDDGTGAALRDEVVALTGSARELPAEWDPEPSPFTCGADGDTSLLDQALSLTGLNRDTFTFDVDLEGLDLLDDPFRLSWFPGVRARPARAGCFEGNVAGGLDQAMRGKHPVASMIRQAAVLLDRASESTQPLERTSFDEALTKLCASTACDAPTGALPDDLRYAMAPLLNAIAGGIDARRAMDAELLARDAEFWRRSGGNLNLGPGQAPDPLADEDRAYLLGENGRRALYYAAAKVAFAAEHAVWSPFAGRTGIRWDMKTAAGWIRVRDGAADTYEDDGEDLLLLIDLGGDDEYLAPVAANRTAANAVSVAIDLGGNDHYGYVPKANQYDLPELLPTDSGGRTQDHVSASQVSRQGGARNGIALLFDLGEGDDVYESLRGSQGYAHLGVGALYDGGGNDVYRAENASQGAAQFGIGILVDAGTGNDARESFSRSQGFGYVGGAGFLVDGGGNDVYLCNNGDPAYGGLPLYESPQLPDSGNTSLCQGAGFGLRADARNLFLSGGIGVLRDRAGDDSYEASVFAQGSGYWQGTGLLSDGDGSDTYDAFWYVQGAAAHFAAGVLADGGAGADVYAGRLPTKNMSHGAGHDFSTGVLIDDGGDDEYHLGTLSAGASNCNGMGLFVDNGGDDRYLARSDYGSGMGNVSGECIDTRPEPVSIGVMIDAAGRDTYEYPESSFTVPTDGGTWGHARNGLPSEHGAGIDSTGETGVHVESGKLQP